jgi:hypothetical protein
MEIAYSFGRSVDVDGDEWIDLGPPPAPCEAAGPGATLHDEENNNPFAVSGTSKAQTNALTKPKETSEPLPEPLPEPEPEPEQVGAKSTLQQVSPEQAQKKAARLQKPRTSVSAPVSKAARSKEVRGLLFALSARSSH